MSWAHSLALRTFVCLEPESGVHLSLCPLVWRRTEAGVHLTGLAHAKHSATEFSPFSLPCPAWARREGCLEGRKGDSGQASRRKLPELLSANICAL